MRGIELLTLTPWESASARSGVLGGALEAAQRRQNCRRLFVFGFVIADHASALRG